MRDVLDGVIFYEVSRKKSSGDLVERSWLGIMIGVIEEVEVKIHALDPMR